MSRRKYTSADRESLAELEQRQYEHTISESYGIPRHVQRNSLSLDDDPDLGYYDYDVLDC